MNRETRTDPAELKEEVRRALRRFLEKTGAPSGRSAVHHRDLRKLVYGRCGKKGRLHREVWGVVIGLTALLVALSLISYSVNDRSLNSPSGPPTPTTGVVS